MTSKKYIFIYVDTTTKRVLFKFKNKFEYRQGKLIQVIAELNCGLRQRINQKALYPQTWTSCTKLVYFQSIIAQLKCSFNFTVNIISQCLKMTRYFKVAQNKIYFKKLKLSNYRSQYKNYINPFKINKLTSFGITKSISIEGNIIEWI